MKLVNKFVIISRDTAIDANDNTLSIFKIVDKFDFNVNKEMFDKALAATNQMGVSLPMTYSVATSWMASEKAKKDYTFKIKMDLIDPDDKVISTNVQDIALSKGNDLTRFTINVQGMVVTRTGRYLIRVTAMDLKDKELAEGSAHLDVNLLTEQQ